MLRLVSSLCLLALAWVAGCSEKPQEPMPVPTVTNPAPAPADGLPPQQLNIPSGASMQSVLDELGRELRRWIRRNQRVPSSFEEFIAGSGLQPPPPPSGKKYAIGPGMTVVLENR